MKTAILILLAEDRKSGQPITDLLPLDEAKRKFKVLCEGGVSPDPRFPIVEMWSGTVKGRRLKGTPSVPATEVTAENTDTGGSLASSLGEGGDGLGKEQVIERIKGLSRGELLGIVSKEDILIPADLETGAIAELLINHVNGLDAPEGGAAPVVDEKSDETDGERDLLTGADETAPKTAETSPGTMSPKGKGKGK